MMKSFQIEREEEKYSLLEKS